MTFPAYLWFLKFFGSEECSHCMDCCLVSGSLWYNYVSSTMTSYSKIFSLDHCKCCKISLEMFTQYRFSLAFKHFGTHLAASFFIPNCSWIINPIYSLDIPDISSILFTKIYQLVKIRSWTWLTNSEANTIQGFSDYVASWVWKYPWHITSSQLISNTCQWMFTSYMNGFPLEFSS